jgi:bifunctional DNA-binding transcriptional regulator/antitoxin component of YhaV-PrlF toxin-antitoxin module
MSFKAKLENRNRIQIPNLLRWRCKMEPGELLKANVRVFGSENYEEETFLAKMARDGRLTIPKLTMEVLKQREGKNLAGSIMEVALIPVKRADEASPAESTETKLLGKIRDIRKNLGSDAVS